MTLQVILVDVPKDGNIRHQVHAPEAWTDPITHERTAYIAGFATKEARDEYLRVRGFRIVDGGGE